MKRKGKKKVVGAVVVVDVFFLSSSSLFCRPSKKKIKRKIVFLPAKSEGQTLRSFHSQSERGR